MFGESSVLSESLFEVDESGESTGKGMLWLLNSYGVRGMGMLFIFPMLVFGVLELELELEVWGWCALRLTGFEDGVVEYFGLVY